MQNGYSNGHRWKLLKPADIVLDEWHPLSGQPAPDFVPAAWDGPHVGKRLSEAFGVLMRMPMGRGPKQFGGTWPGFPTEYSDLVQYADDAAWKRDQASEKNRIIIRPSSREIELMETAISWPAHYLIEVPQQLRAVGVVALCRSRDMEIRDAARRLRLQKQFVLRCNNDGLDRVARGLRADRAPVF